MSDLILARLSEVCDCAECDPGEQAQPLVAALRAVLDLTTATCCPNGYDPLEPGCGCLQCAANRVIAEHLGVTDA